ncbi:MAG: type II toxin-antitoxin system VapC family toxin [Gracilimonas sp.]|uniref:type II toxin-antitoxin system VapC family toxin n=1 Tax=Gracilimonas sp. TaxID=1974203 RepID=UPI0019CAD968|nr:type II toxin-antitoxin system VapC family toxin [Gracilimonas sp.]MBD3616725.1 type II toxin-antitoxin system VapC family toxin [Gracilimonas sp.]
MSIVLDASIAAKWIFLEEDSDKAEQLLKDHSGFLVPDLFYIEMDSLIGKKVQRRELEASDAHRKRDQVQRIAADVVYHQTLAKLAFDISISLPVTMYDALYLALAMDNQTKMWTADNRLVRGLSNTILSKHIENPLKTD